MGIGLHHLRYFMVVAEEGNVSRAAARLHVAQPSLSAQIKYLERHLGVELFRRHPGGVELTRAGTLFLTEARESLRSADAAVALARTAARDQAGMLSIGFLLGTHVEITSRIIQAFRDRRPEVRIEFAEYTFAEPSAGLNGHDVDLAFVMPPFKHEGLAFLEIWAEPRVAVLPATHPLAVREAISVRELFDEPWIVADTDDEVCRAFWLAMDHRDGIPPKVGPPTRSMDKFINLVLAGEVVGLAVASMAEKFTRPGIRYIPVPDVEPVATALAWHPDSPNTRVNTFIAVAKDCLAR